MKNIYLIQTDKPSRLVYNEFATNQYHIFKTLNNEYKSLNIYITNSEEIKDGWYLNGNYVYKYDVNYEKALNDRKIVITNDADLIKDGAQQISNEFLEWYIDNQSCEEVEVKKYKKYKGSHLDCANTCGQCDCGLSPCKQMYFTYETIIPSEQSKQLTLKEVPLNYAKNELKDRGTESDILICSIDFINGAEWQAKKMSSEEEVFKLLCDFNYDLEINEVNDIIEWFNKNKKK